MGRKRKRKQRPMPTGTSFLWYEGDLALWEWLAPFAATHDMTQVIKLALYRLSGIEPEGETFAALMKRVEERQVHPATPNPADLLDAFREIVREEMADARRDGDDDTHRGGQGGSGSGGVIRDDIRFDEVRNDVGGVAASGANPTSASPIPSSRLMRSAVGGNGSRSQPDSTIESSGIDMSRRRSRPRPRVIKQPPTLPELPPVDDVDLAALGREMAQSIARFGKQP